jgi:hypothetical protein
MGVTKGPARGQLTATSRPARSIHSLHPVMASTGPGILRESATVLSPGRAAATAARISRVRRRSFQARPAQADGSGGRAPIGLPTSHTGHNKSARCWRVRTVIKHVVDDESTLALNNNTNTDENTREQLWDYSLLLNIDDYKGEDLPHIYSPNKC